MFFYYLCILSFLCRNVLSIFILYFFINIFTLYSSHPLYFSYTLSLSQQIREALHLCLPERLRAPFPVCLPDNDRVPLYACLADNARVPAFPFSTYQHMHINQTIMLQTIYNIIVQSVVCNECPEALACVKGIARHSSCVSLSTYLQSIKRYMQLSSCTMH